MSSSDPALAGAGAAPVIMILRSRWIQRGLLVVIGTTVALLMLEVAGRISGLDFARQEALYAQQPIYYRQPRVPDGEVYFRRPGPDSWTGQVRRTGLRLAGFTDEAYRDETPITATYDSQGFRNPPEMRDWRVAIAGDSFTELGYLAYDELFTTHLSRDIAAPVKNIGLSYTGPHSYVFRLQKYGLGPSTTDVVMAFFEGNDLEDLRREHADHEQLRTTGTRPYRNVTPQSSAVHWLYGALARTLVYRDLRARNGTVMIGDRELPMTWDYAPPSAGEMTSEQTALLRAVLADFGAFSAAHGVRPWLLYLPCKLRVYHELARFDPPALPKLKEWRPNDLPQFVAEIAARYGIRFVDATQSLRLETERGEMTYNTIWDTHLNEHGSRIVGRVLSDAMRGTSGE